jgi:hypothetical protein
MWPFVLKLKQHEACRRLGGKENPWLKRHCARSFASATTIFQTAALHDLQSICGRQGQLLATAQACSSSVVLVAPDPNVTCLHIQGLVILGTEFLFGPLKGPSKPLSNTVLNCGSYWIPHTHSHAPHRYWIHIHTLFLYIGSDTGSGTGSTHTFSCPTPVVQLHFKSKVEVTLSQNITKCCWVDQRVCA